MITAADLFRGQTRARRLLEAYLAKGRLAGSFLLLGQRGLGKTTLGTILSRALTCENNQSHRRLHFCGECYACRSIAAGDQPEFVQVRPRTKQITIEMVEEDFRGFSSASLHPTLLTHRVFLIQDAHYLNEQSANQLLKVLEEPPEGTVFILDTDKPELLLPTIHSRGQRVTLSPLAAGELVTFVQQDVPEVDNAAAWEAAQMSGGRYVDAGRLAVDQGWRTAVKRLAALLFSARAIDGQVGTLAELEYGALWAKELADTGLDDEEAERSLPKERLREIERQALIAAYDRAAWWALRDAPPQPGFAEALSELKARINQNVDPVLAQAAFEATILRV